MKSEGLTTKTYPTVAGFDCRCMSTPVCVATG